MPLSISVKLADMPESVEATDEAIQEHILGREVVRSQGYLDRLARFETRKACG